MPLKNTRKLPNEKNRKKTAQPKVNIILQLTNCNLQVYQKCRKRFMEDSEIYLYDFFIHLCFTWALKGSPTFIPASDATVMIKSSQCPANILPFCKIFSLWIGFSYTLTISLIHFPKMKAFLPGVTAFSFTNWTRHKYLCQIKNKNITL